MDSKLDPFCYQENRRVQKLISLSPIANNSRVEYSRV